MDMGYGCEILFNSEKARAMQELVEGATGDLCPCKRMMACPLLPFLPQGATAPEAA